GRRRGLFRRLVPEKVVPGPGERDEQQEPEKRQDEWGGPPLPLVRTDAPGRGGCGDAGRRRRQDARRHLDSSARRVEARHDPFEVLYKLGVAGV
ncbi:MAG: hypothetical protein AVDCRST_MAG05-2882, partial [uncultured Rubrobacteraceae bacterium]